MERVKQTRKPRKCPSCGYTPLGTIFYGYPSPDFWESKKEEINSGEIIIGGCEGVVDRDSPSPIFPSWECLKCKQQIWKIPRRKKRIELSRRPKKCPTCTHSPVGTILWGEPDMTPELRKSMNEGKVIIGGCCLSPDDPTWECSNCNQQIWEPVLENERLGVD